MRLAPHFTLDEFAVSASHPLLVEAVPPRFVGVVTLLALDVLQPIREAIGRPMRITSAYRAPALNRAVGGSRTSQHKRGEAADWTCDDLSDAWAAVRQLVVDGRLNGAGQLIYYPARGFVHAALPSRKYPGPTTCLHWPERGWRYARFLPTDPVWAAVEALRAGGAA